MARRPSETLFSDGLRPLQNALSVAPAQAGARPEAQLQLFEHVGFRQNAQTTELCFNSAPSGCATSACVFYEDCGFHAYDYAVSRRAYYADTNRRRYD